MLIYYSRSAAGTLFHINHRNIFVAKDLGSRDQALVNKINENR